MHASCGISKEIIPHQWWETIDPEFNLPLVCNGIVSHTHKFATGYTIHGVYFSSKYAKNFLPQLHVCTMTNITVTFSLYKLLAIKSYHNCHTKAHINQVCCNDQTYNYFQPPIWSIKIKCSAVSSFMNNRLKIKTCPPSNALLNLIISDQTTLKTCFQRLQIHCKIKMYD